MYAMMFLVASSVLYQLSEIKLKQQRYLLNVFLFFFAPFTSPSVCDIECLYIECLLFVNCKFHIGHRSEV